MDSFVRVMHAGNFSTAAHQLGVSRTLISRHIIELERHLGFTLLNRSTRKVAPTDEAREYLKFCERVFGELEREQDFVLYRERSANVLKVVAPKSFGVLKLADAIMDFTEAQPRFRISLSLEDFSFRLNEFSEKGYDLAICISSIRESALISRRIASLEWILCATPEYVRRYGRPQSPQDLKNHSCLAHLNLELNDRIWRFKKEAAHASIRIDGPFRSNSVIVLRKAALRSLGIASLPRYAIASDLTTGSLVPLMPRYPQPYRPLTAVYPRSAAALAKVKAFVPWLANWFRKNDPNRDTALPLRT
jgi:DNA-binding transcriptional LysR family regulator